MYHFALKHTDAPLGVGYSQKLAAQPLFGGLVGVFFLMPICIKTLLLLQNQNLSWRSGTWLILLSSFFNFHPPLFHIPWLSNSEKYSDSREQERLQQNLACQPGRINSVQAVLIQNSESFSDHFQSALHFCLGRSAAAVSPPGKGCCIAEQKKMILVPDSLKPYSESIC